MSKDQSFFSIIDNALDVKKDDGKVKWIKRVIIRKGVTDPKKLAILTNMLRQIFHYGKRDRQIRVFALKLMNRYNVKAKDNINEVKTLMGWIQNDNNFRYTFDPYNVEYFQTARRMLWDYVNGMKSKAHKSLLAGDCDDKSIFMASFLGAVGYHAYLLLVDSRGDGVYSHCMAGVKFPKPYNPYGKKIVPIELTKNVALGWRTPKASKVYVIDLETRGPGREKFVGYVSKDLY